MLCILYTVQAENILDIENLNLISMSLKETSFASTEQHTWILGVVSEQLRLLNDRVGDSTTSVNSLSPQISELVKDAVASWCGDIVWHFWLIRNELRKFVELKFEFFSFNTFDVSQIFWQRVVQTTPKYSYCISWRDSARFLFIGYWITHCMCSMSWVFCGFYFVIYLLWFS